MKSKFMKGKGLLFITLGLVLTSCGMESFKEKETYNLILNATTNGSFYVMKQGEVVNKAKQGDLLSISCVSDKGYKVNEIKVNDKVISEFSFIMPSSNTSISVSFSPIVSNIEIENSLGGTITSDKTSAQYGELVTLTIIPSFSYYGIERSLVVNKSEIYKSRIYSETKVKFLIISPANSKPIQDGHPAGEGYFPSL